MESELKKGALVPISRPDRSDASVRRIAAAARRFISAYNRWWVEDQGADGVWDDKTVEAFGDLESAVNSRPIATAKGR